MENQLEIGKKIELEHKDTYLYLRKYVQEYNDLPPIEKFVEMIAKDHLKEFPDYYTRLEKMENGKA